MNRNAVGQRIAPFALDRLAMARVEGAQKILETAIALVMLVKLLVVALQESVFAQKLPFGFACEGHMNR